MISKETSFELFLRIVLLIFYVWLDFQDPFIRVIQTEEWWLYKNPHTPSSDVSVTTGQLFWIAFFIPCLIIIAFETWHWRKRDAVTGLLAISLAVLINGTFTNIIKLMVGRPRPDFFERCFPDGKPRFEGLTPICSGVPDTLSEGRKSFPSGHSSWSFTGLLFLSYYLAGKLRSFAPSQNRGMMRLVIPLIPVIIALYIAMTRYCDYWHHYQDIVWGSVIGAVVATLSYFYYYPPLWSEECGQPLNSLLQIPGGGRGKPLLEPRIKPLSRTQSTEKLHTVKIM